MAYDYYTMQLGKDYVLSLFQGALDDIIAKDRPDLNCWADCIMDWYEDQLEYDELDWEISSIPSLVWSDIVQSRMVIITEKDEEFDEIDKLYETDGVGSVDSQYVARICFKTADNSGHAVYLCQKEA